MIDKTQILGEAIDQAMIPERSLLERLRIRPTDRFEEPHIMWSIVNENNQIEILGTAGNFSLVIGKAKAKKTFFLNIAISMVVINDFFLTKFKGSLLKQQNVVLYFDTEQSKGAVWKSLDRICRHIDIADPENLHCYGFRSIDTASRVQLIEAAIYDTPNVGFVIIDGIRDLVHDFMDPKEASMIAGKLLKWTEEKNIHIITVLHQNKGDNNARGHLGTELINKAETVLSVTKAESNKDVSIVAPEQCRNTDFVPFAFEINDVGLPVLVENFQDRGASNQSGVKVSEIEDFKLFQLLTEIFSRADNFKYSEFLNQLKITFEKQIGKSIGTNKAGELMTLFQNNKWLIKHENSKIGYLMGTFNKVL
ncbi:MAG: AAA family ATPase [Flavobacterium sp.]|nr:AAA family ATPase [Pedobacter sp.]